MSNFCETCLSEPCCCVKTCSKCKVKKLIEDFHKDNRRLDGLYSSCKSCKKLYHDKNKKAINSRKRKNRADNIEAHRERDKRYRETNKDSIRVSHRNYRNKRYKEDLKFRTSKKLGSSIRKCLRRLDLKKDFKTEEALGCSFEAFKHRLETMFTEGMSWDNYGEWHIDHIIPLASAQTVDDVYRLNHYSNLQPLWARDNIKKGDSLEWKMMS